MSYDIATSSIVLYLCTRSLYVVFIKNSSRVAEKMFGSPLVILFDMLRHRVYSIPIEINVQAGVSCKSNI